MITMDQALDTILAAVRPLESERVPLIDAVGRVLSETIHARRPLPQTPVSEMDGYAVRAAEVSRPGTVLPISDEVRAGDPGDRPLKLGTAARIFTGAPVPDGADAVIMQEEVRRASGGTDRAEFHMAAECGRYIRPAGTDVAEGQAVVRSGHVIGPGDVGAIASVGRSFVSVVRAPVVAVLSSGDELIEVDGGEPRRGQTINSNVLALAAAARTIGAAVRLFPTIPDDRGATIGALRSAARADALITSGGVSVGAYDFVREALAELSGDDFAFWKVAVKPGKPLAFGHISGCAVFALPGNPVSAAVSFEIFVRPALLRMMGHRAVKRRIFKGVLDSPTSAGCGRHAWLRASAHWTPDGELHVDPFKSQRSGDVSSIAGVDALVGVGADDAPRTPGSKVDVILLGPDNPSLRVP